MAIWQAEIKKVKVEAPGIARALLIFSKGKDTFERELKLVADNFQTRQDIDNEIARQLAIINNFQVTIDTLKAELDKNP